MLTPFLIVPNMHFFVNVSNFVFSLDTVIFSINIYLCVDGLHLVAMWRAHDEDNDINNNTGDHLE